MTMPSVTSHRLRMAARILRAGGVIAYPTEAVYGLGCDPWNRDAVMRLLALKARPPSKGLILIAAALEQLTPFVDSLPPERMSQVCDSWPGANTWLLPVRPGTPNWLSGRFDTLAVRVTAHPLASALCRVYGGAIVSTSANRAGRPPARTSLDVRRAFGGRLDHLLVGRCLGADRPSVIRDGRTGQVLRS